MLNEKVFYFQVFSEYLHVPDRFLELPSSLKHSHIAFFYAAKDAGKLAAKYPLSPRKFGWLTELGVYAGNIDHTGASGDTVTVDCQLVPMPESTTSGAAFFADSGNASASIFPLGLVVTEFHALLAYSNRVRGICLLNEQVRLKRLGTEVTYLLLSQLYLVRFSALSMGDKNQNKLRAP